MGRFINADVFVSTGQGFVGNNMFAYCGNNPVMFIDCSGNTTTTSEWIEYMWWLLLADGPYPFADAIFIGGAATFLFIDLITTNTVPQQYEQLQRRKEEIVVAVQTQDNPNPNAEYYGVRIVQGKWTTITPPMTYEETITWIGIAAISGEFGRDASWGVYTQDIEDAYYLAVAVGDPDPVPHYHEYGLRAHFHVHGNFLDRYKHFHIWFGELYFGGMEEYEE